MEDLQAIVSRFPQRELDIRRCFLADPEFRSICADYRVATEALWRWRSAGAARSAAGLVEDYTALVGELEAEILAQLEHRPLPAGRST